MLQGVSIPDLSLRRATLLAHAVHSVQWVQEQRFLVADAEGQRCKVEADWVRWRRVTPAEST